MERIDSHQHFWHYNPAKHVWMNDTMAAIKRDFLPNHLLPLLNNCNLQGCIAIQANQAEEENDFLLALAKANSFIKGIVGWVNLQADNVAERLAHYQQFHAIKGFRHVLHDEEDIDFMLRPAFLNGIKALKEFGYTYDILIFPKHLPNTLQLVQQFPNQPFVIDHIAKPNIGLKQYHDWKQQLAAIAAYENVYCKISGMVTETNWGKWKPQDFTAYLDAIVELFGTNRIMYGSDWPVCTLSATYQNQYNIVENYFNHFSLTEQTNFFGENAKRFYKF